MADPTSSTTVPHLLGITLDAQGIANSQVIIRNRTTGETQRKNINATKVAVVDAASFTSGYSAGDIIEFQNVGGSVGIATITINSATGGFQEATLDAVAAPTVAITL